MPGPSSKMEKKVKRNGAAAVVTFESNRLAVGGYTRDETYAKDEYSSLKGSKSSQGGSGVRNGVADAAELVNGESNGSFIGIQTSSVSSQKVTGHCCQESCITENGSDRDEFVGIGSLHSPLLQARVNGNGSAKNVHPSVAVNQARKRKRVEEAVKNVGSEEQQSVKSVKLSEEARVWQYVCRRSVFVSPPIRKKQICPTQFNSVVSFHGGGLGNADLFNNVVFTEKTTNTEVKVNQTVIKVTLTKESEVVQEWIERQSATQFGLDLEWQPNRRKGQKDNKVALLQISTETECLLVQMLFLDTIPEALVQLLKDPKRKLAGVGIHDDTKKLYRDYRLASGGEVELITLAVTHFKNQELKRVGLKALATQVLGFCMNKSKSVTMSNWSKSHLERKQVEYACIDAWVSLAIFVRLQNSPGLAA